MMDHRPVEVAGSDRLLEGQVGAQCRGHPPADNEPAGGLGGTDSFEMKRCIFGDTASSEPAIKTVVVNPFEIDERFEASFERMPARPTVETRRDVVRAGAPRSGSR